MKYYYLDGIEKKGPYTLEEILSRNLSSDTMIYREDKTNWLALSNFEELNKIENIESDEVIIPIEEVTNVDEKDKITIDEVKIKLPKHTILIILIVVSIGIAALITYFQQKNDYNKIDAELNTIFKSKKTISDYIVHDNLSGKLYDVVYHSGKKIADIKLSDYVTANDIILNSEPYNNPNDNNNYLYNDRKERWEQFKNLKQYYIKGPHMFSGFLALKASREKERISITEYYSGDMAYKVPEKIHHKGFDYGYFSTPGYDIPTYRPSIIKCYEGAAEFLTKDSKDSTYVPDSYLPISNIRYGTFDNDFYQISNYGDEYLYSTDTIKVFRQDGTRSFVIDNEKITESTSRNDAYVYTTDWIVWYKSVHNNFEIKPKKWVFLKYWCIYSVISILIMLILRYFIKNRKRIVIE